MTGSISLALGALLFGGISGLLIPAQSELQSQTIPLVAVEYVTDPSRSASDSFSVTGIWEGSFTCGSASSLVTLTIESENDSGAARVDYYPPVGKSGASGSRSYEYEVDPFTGSINLTAGALIDGEKSPDISFDGLVSEDGNTLEGTADLRRQCGTFHFRRVTSPAQLQEATASLVEVTSAPPAVTIMEADTPQEFCDAFQAWGDQLIAAFPDIRSAHDLRGVPPQMERNLFRDDRFEPFFGFPTSTITKQIYQAIDRKYRDRRECRLRDEEMFRVLYSMYRTTQNTVFKRGIADIEAATDWKERIIGSLDRLPQDQSALDRLDELAAEAAERLEPLWPTDLAELMQAISAKRTQLEGQVVAALVETEKALPSKEELASLLRLSQSPEAGQPAMQKAEEWMVAYVDAAVRETDPDMPAYEKLLNLGRLQAEIEKEFQAYSTSAAFRAGLARLSSEMQNLTPPAEEELRLSLAAAVQAQAFYPIRDQVIRARNILPQPSTYERFWDLYHDAVNAWVDGVIADSTKNAASGGGDFPAGSEPDKQDTAFDATNPLGRQTPDVPVTSAADSAFRTQPWTNSAVMVGTYEADFGRLHEFGADGAKIYLGGVTAEIGNSCPNLKSLEVELAGQSALLGSDIRNPDLQRLGMEQLENLAKNLQNPGRLMDAAIQQEEFRRSVSADAVLFLRNFDCYDEAAIRFQDNALAFVRDPMKGVPADKLSMRDICISHLRRNNPPVSSPESYCRCAGDILTGFLSENQRLFLVASEEPTFNVMLNLYPMVDAELRQCRR
ncbi:hypothetical protein SAMN06297251_101462 [Fulvimarina manganoxydans]|uniref:Uncharacterized protein n=1 Tax=Fulvimarina manganoxydans TaxID=937218 RepID=A0A1W1YM32_9HYPH|nr:hypothetical protein [Fulvimarina manganoxydans]SMC37186.1 hypothetical protein SAMN06297251_101462 [Fulvimarina manganoxydans]